MTQASQTMTFTNARVIDPANGIDDNGSVTLTNGVISEVSLQPDTAVSSANTVDCGGQVLCPGFIDMRAHKVDWQAAAAGGITTVILQPDQTTPIDNDAAVERIRARAASSATVNVYPMGAATKGFNGREISEIGQMHQSGAVAFTDCFKPVADAQVMRRLLEYSQYFQALIVQFPQELSLSAGGVAHEGEIATRLGLTSIPVEAEAMQIERDVRLSMMTGTPIHFALISSRMGVEAIRRAKADGAQITAATAPHYLMLNENALEGYRTFAKVSPPLRSEEDRLALIGAVVDGTIDVITSDHSPVSADKKRLPFAQADNGIAGAETMLALALTLLHTRKMSLMDILTCFTHKPAKLLGLKGGTLDVGHDADITIFNPEKPWRVNADDMLANARNTPFDTLPVQGKVWRTYVAGRCVFQGD